MTEQNKKTINITNFKRKRELNIGMFLFAVVLIYLLITVFLYLTSKHISIYEVRKGSILKDNSYTGLILREENVVKAENSGYLTYFVSESSKVKKGTAVYTLSDDSLISETSAQTDDTALSSGEQAEILLNLQNFCDVFQESDFSSVYSLKEEISGTLQSANNQTMVAQLDAILSERPYDNIQVYSAERDGIIIFSVDGYEDVTADTFKSSDLVKANLQTTVLKGGGQVSSGDPVYKIISNETWSVVVEINEETAALLKETTRIKTRIAKDEELLWASLQLIKKEGNTYACLTYDNSMIRYASERYLDIELIIEDETGLKIPKTAVTEKEFYKVPSEYLTYGGDSSSAGVLVQTSSKKTDISAEFVEAGTVYYSQDEKTCYLDPALFRKNAVLVNPDTMETYALQETYDMKGAFNINKGYAVFKQIEILCENDEYYIVSEETPNGLSNYDHIVLDGTTVKENEIVFQ